MLYAMRFLDGQLYISKFESLSDDHFLFWFHLKVLKMQQFMFNFIGVLIMHYDDVLLKSVS